MHVSGKPDYCVHMSEQDFTKVTAAVAALTGRTYNATEWAEAYGLSRSAWYDAKARDGDLLVLWRLAIVAEHLRINPVALFVELGAIDLNDVMEYAREMERKYEQVWGAGSPPLGVVPTKEREASAPVTPAKSPRNRRSDAPSL